MMMMMMMKMMMMMMMRNKKKMATLASRELSGRVPVLLHTSKHTTVAVLVVLLNYIHGALHYRTTV